MKCGECKYFTVLSAWGKNCGIPIPPCTVDVNKKVGRGTPACGDYEEAW